VNSPVKYFLLYDEGHYHSINNIKGFLSIDYFCCNRLCGFHHKKAYDEHKCEECAKGCVSKKSKQKVKSSKIGKDLQHYLHEQPVKGGTDEVENKLNEYIEKN